MAEGGVVVRRLDEEPAIAITPRTHLAWLARTSETHDAYALQHFTQAAGGTWVPLHRHLHDDEAQRQMKRLQFVNGAGGEEAVG